MDNNINEVQPADKNVTPYTLTPFWLNNADLTQPVPLSQNQEGDSDNNYLQYFADWLTEEEPVSNNPSSLLAPTPLPLRVSPDLPAQPSPLPEYAGFLFRGSPEKSQQEDGAAQKRIRSSVNGLAALIPAKHQKKSVEVRNTVSKISMESIDLTKDDVVEDLAPQPSNKTSKFIALDFLCLTVFLQVASKLSPKNEPLKLSKEIVTPAMEAINNKYGKYIADNKFHNCVDSISSFFEHIRNVRKLLGIKKDVTLGINFRKKAPVSELMATIFPKRVLNKNQQEINYKVYFEFKKVTFFYSDLHSNININIDDLLQSSQNPEDTFFKEYQPNFSLVVDLEKEENESSSAPKHFL